MGKFKPLSKEKEEDVSRWVGLVKEFGVDVALEMKRKADKLRKQHEKRKDKLNGKNI